MNSGRLAVRYARAFIETIPPANREAVYHEVLQFIEVYEHIHASVVQVMSSSVITVAKKEEFISAFAVRYAPSLPPLLRLVVRKGRGLYIQRILFELERLLRRELGIVRVVVESPVEYGSEVREVLEKAVAGMVEGERFQYVYRVKPDLIGGFRLRVQGRMLDRSVRGELGRMARALEP